MRSFTDTIRTWIRRHTADLHSSGMLQGQNLLAIRIAAALLLALSVLAAVFRTDSGTLPQGTGAAEGAVPGGDSAEEHYFLWNHIRGIMQDAQETHRPALEEAARAYQARKQEAEKRIQELEARLDGNGGYPEGEALWKLFSDAVIFGDSRVTGFSIYGFLPEERVLAETSTNITAIDGLLDKADAASPARIYVSYGINDVATGLWRTPEDYAEEVLHYAKLLQERYPEAQVCINSILPASPEACEERSLWKVLPDYSAAMKKACADSDICYIDNGALAAAHWDLYAGDGIHFSTEFYELWAQNMLREADRFEAAHLAEAFGEEVQGY